MSIDKQEAEELLFEFYEKAIGIMAAKIVKESRIERTRRIDLLHIGVKILNAMTDEDDYQTCDVDELFI